MENTYNPVSYSNMARTFRSILPDSDIDFEEEINRNVAEQRRVMNGPTDEEREKMFIDEITGVNGATSIGGFLVPSDKNQALQNYTNLPEDEKLRLKSVYIDESFIQAQDPLRPVVPFSGKKYEQIRLSPALKRLPANVQEKFVEVIQNRQRLAKVFVDNKYQLSNDAYDIIMDSFVTGDFLTELYKFVSNTGADFARAPTLIALAGSAAESGLESILSADDEFGMKKSYGEKFKDNFDRNMSIAGTVLVPYEDFLNKSEFTDSAAYDIQQWYKSKFYAQYDDKETADLAWSLSGHQKIRQKIYREGDPNFDPNVRDGQSYVGPALDDESNVIFDDIGLPGELVQDMVDIAYRELPNYQKAAMFAAGMMPLTVGLGALAVRKGTKYATQVQNFRLNNPGMQGLDKLTDYQVYKRHIKGRKSEGDAWRTVWRTLTFNIGQVGPGTLNYGKNINRHLNIIKSYDDQLQQLNGFVRGAREDVQSLDDMAGYSPEAAQLVNIFKNGTPEQALDANQKLTQYFKSEQTRVRKNVDNYKLRSGYNKYDNPYTRSLLADDMIISAAVGYAPSVLTMFEPDTAEMITGITAPIFAPALVRGPVYAATNIRMVKDIPEAVGGVFEYAPFVGKFFTRMREAREQTDLRKMMEDIGVEVTERSMKAFDLLRKMYNNMNEDMRTRTDRAFSEYNSVMDGIVSSLRTATKRDIKTDELVPAFDEDTIKEMMSTLHLSVAQASGLSPFIAIQSRASEFKPRDIMNEKKLALIATAIKEEEQSLTRIGELMKVFRTKYEEETGVDPSSNVQLQEFLADFARIEQEGLDGISMKRQEMLRMLNSFARSPELPIEPDTVTELVRLKTLFAPEEIHDMINSAEGIASVAMSVAEGARVKTRELAAFHSTMREKELNGEVALAVDSLFDAELGYKYALGKLPYREADNYAIKNGLTVNLMKLGERLHNVNSALDKSFLSAGKDRRGKVRIKFGPARDYLQKVGNNALVVFENAAERGLVAEYGDEVIEMMNTSGETNFLDFALKLMKDDPDANLFRATPSEAEELYRAFRRYEMDTSGMTLQDLNTKYTPIINDAIKAADKTLYDMTVSARSNWEKTVGMQTDKGTLAGDTVVVRRNSEAVTPRQGKHLYKKGMTPMKAFVQLADSIAEFVVETDPSKRATIEGAILDHKEYVVGFLSGGNRLGGAEFGFDLSDERRRINADTGSTILEMLVSKRLNAKYQAQLEDLQTSIERQTYGLVTRPDAVARLASGNQYDFSRAQRLFEVEKMMSVPVRGGSNADVEYHVPIPTSEEGLMKFLNEDRGRIGVGPPVAPPTFDISDAVGENQRRFFFKVDNIVGSTRDVDDLMKNDVYARREYESLRTDLNDANSEFNIAVRREEDAVKQSLKQMGTYGDLASDPKQFFDAVFLRATPESLERTVEYFVNNGMNRDDVRRNLAYMYQQGFDAYVKSSMGTRQGDITGMDVILREPEKLLEFTAGEKGEVMRFVLGDDHFNDMKLLARYSRIALGEGAGFRISPDIRAMTLDNVFSKSFNLARGMVSIPYVAAEVGGRVMLLRNQSMIGLALSDKSAARIMRRVFEGDKITRSELQLLGLRIKNYIARDLITSEGDLPAIDALLEIAGAEEVQTETLSEITAKQKEKRRERVTEEVERMYAQ
jgi:hypothetical protein